MAQKKTTSSSKKSQKPRARVKDLTPSKEGAARVRGGKLPGKRTPPTVTLKRGMTR